MCLHRRGYPESGRGIRESLFPLYRTSLKFNPQELNVGRSDFPFDASAETFWERIREELNNRNFRPIQFRIEILNETTSFKK
jgi:hypothetical protein